MKKARTYQTEAIILGHLSLGEADRIVTLYTLEYGKIDAISKGARRPGSKMGGHLETLTRTTLMISRGRSLDIITQSQTINAFLGLREDLQSLSAGLYMAELVDSLTMDSQQTQPVYELLSRSLEDLSELGYSELLLRYFELHLLGHLGFRPRFSNCSGCGATLKPAINYFSAAQGGMLCPNCVRGEFLVRAVSLNALKVLRLWQDTDFLTARRVRVDRILADEIESVNKHLITHLLERETRSLAWLKRLKREKMAKSVDSNGN